MSLSDITEQVTALGHAWEQFKHVNDARLGEIERKGAADPLYMEHLSRISDALDNTKGRLDRIETVVSRPALPEIGESKAYDPTAGAYRKAFLTYLRKGMDAGLEALQTKALLVGSDPEGGYLVTPAMSQRIVTAIFETSPIRKLAAVETISTDALELIDDHTSAAAGWTAETCAVSDSANPTVAKRNIPVHELYAQPKATQKLVDDAAIDIESWIAGKVADIFARMENSAFVGGTGVGQPRGFLTYPAGTAWGQVQQIGSGSSGNVTADSLITLFYSLKDAYMKRASFLMNRAVIAQVRLLKATTNQYLWQPSLTAGSPDTLLGVPVYMAADMPVAAAGSLSVAVGDFAQAYQIVDRQGIAILRDPFTDKPFVKFYTTKRVGGDVVNFDAVKLLSLA
ncbi:MAG: phage major capsid protein [Alphaproteobacteria bacterium]|nr:phage major capsid protein [Alphaproteobacteria bacterium]